MRLFAFVAIAAATAVHGDRTITKVIKLLEAMLDKSKSDGKADRELYAKQKCYCDKNEEEKNASVASLNEQIGLLQSEIAALRASSSKLSQEVAQLDRDMTANQEARDQATEIRNKAKEEFDAEEADLVAAIGQMKNAIETLQAIGADQTQSVGADHQKFMAADATAAAKSSLVSLQKKLTKALTDAAAFLPPKQQKKALALVEAPFTGTYTSQSVEIVGILKNMLDTFEANLASARSAEARAVAAHEKFMATKTEEFNTMKDLYDAKQDSLGQNDGALASAQETLDTAETNLGEDTDFLAALLPACADKAKNYDNRKLMRANEEAAISEAVAILSSDDAFETFGATDAATTGTSEFVQIKKHHSEAAQVVAMLEKTAKQTHSVRLSGLAAMVATNPFATVLSKIGEMITVIDEEEKADDDQKAWCDTERDTNNEALAQKNERIQALDSEITDLNDQIDNPETGLKAQLVETNTLLNENRANQKSITEQRSSENAAYQVNVANLQKAEAILEKATKVLQKYYAWLHRKTAPHHYEAVAGKDSRGADIKRLAGASVEQLEEACSEDPNCAGFNSDGWLKSAVDSEFSNPAGSLYKKVFETENPVASLAQQPVLPEGELEDHVGQKSDGSSAVNMLLHINAETKKEENAAHTTERDAQHEYEDAMTQAKADEASQLESIASLEASLAEAEKALEEAHINLSATEKAKMSIEQYLAKIKPGCDFIDANIDTRKANRAAEKSALENAISLLKGTPAFQAAVAQQTRENQGKCAGKCEEFGVDHVECKACLAETTIPGYCAGHEGVAGC
jgi:uncharacterized small protein (DUF1192 family)